MATMTEQRQHQRISCAEKCLLYYKDFKFSGAVTNISISGALVSLYGSVYDAFIPGETCSLLLCNDPTTSFIRYKSRITRADRTGVGLKILEHEFC